jgi:anti-sigma B factor antagonist
VSAEHYPVAWLGEVAVVTLPAEIDVTNADQVREDLLSLLNRGTTMLVVDMSATTFCDSAGVNALIRAFKRATASASGMRLVVTTRAVQRILGITGVDHLIDVYPTVAAAVAACDQPGPGVTPERLLPRPSADAHRDEHRRLAWAIGEPDLAADLPYHP